MARRSPLILLELAAAATAALSVVAGMAFVLLSRGPIPLDFLTPYIEGALSPAGGPVGVRIESTLLTWDGWQKPVDVRAKHVRIHNPAGAEMATLDQVSIGLSLRALMTRLMVAPTSLEIRKPTVRLTRTSDGHFEFGLGASGEQPALQRLILGLLAQPNPNEASGYLERVSITDADLILDDQMLEMSWKALNAKVKIERDQGGLAADFEMPFLVDDKPAAVRGEIKYQLDGSIADIALEFAEIVPARFAAGSPALERLAALDLPMSGEVKARLRPATGEIERVSFDLNGGRGRLMLRELGAQGLDIAAARIVGRARNELSFYELENVYFDLGGPSLQASAVINVSSGQSDIKMHLIASKLSVADLNRLWPQGVRPELRGWVRDHVTAGRADETRVWLAGRASRKQGFEPDFDNLKMVTLFSGVSGSAPNGMQLSGASGRVVFGAQQMELLVTDATAKWPYGDLPPLTDIKATANIAPNRQAEVRIKEAKFGGMTLIADSIKIDRLGQPTVEVNGEVRLDGSLSTMLAMVQKANIAGARELEVDPAQVKGTMGLRARFRFDLVPNLSLDRVSRTATMTIADMELPKGPMGLNLSANEITVVYDAQSIKMAGLLKLNGVPVAVDMTRTVTGRGDDREHIHLAGSLTDAQRQALGLETAKIVSGPVDFDVDVTRAEALTRVANAKLRLDKAKVRVAQLYWEKDKGLPGELDLTMTLRRGQPVEVNEFSMTGGDMNAKGRAWLIGGSSSLKKIEFDHLTFNGQGGTDVKAVVDRRVGGGWDVELEGKQLSLQPYIEDPDILLDFPLGVTTRVERLRIDDRRMLYNVRLEADFGGEYWNSIELNSQLGDDGDLAVNYRPTGNLRDLYIYASDASQALQLMTGTSVARDLHGGKIYVKATRSPMQPDAPMDGQVQLRNFSLRDSATGDKILASSSGFGPFEILSMTDLDFEFLDAKFRKTSDHIELQQLYARSPGLGMFASGTFDLASGTMDIKGYVSPFRGIGKLLDENPWIGAFLVDVDKQGLIAVPFSGTGSMASPDIDVSKDPTSLPPGEMREFAYQIAGKDHEGKARDLSAAARMKPATAQP